MQSKAIGVFRIMLLIGIFLAMSFCVFMLWHPQNEKSLFDLQQEYAAQVRHQISDLLEPIVGPGNVQTAAQIYLQQIDQTIVSKEVSPHNQYITKTTRYQGPALQSQHISLILNSTNRILESDVWNLVEGALGIDFSQGDTLSIRMIPFVRVPFWSFGLARVTLIRLAGILILIMLFLMMGLFYLYKKAQTISMAQQPHPNEKLWQKAIQLSPTHISNALSVASADVSAFILYRFPTELAGQITNLLPNEYLTQVMLHMEHLSNLTQQAYKNLLFKSEMLLAHLLQKKDIPNSSEKVAEILATSRQKEAILNNMSRYDKHTTQNVRLSALTLDDLTQWSKENFQTLLQYLDKETAIAALQTAPLKLHQCFADNLPTTTWNEIAKKCQQTPFSLNQSQQAQQKVLDIARNLIINHLVHSCPS